MTDDVGMMQHATFDVPNRNTGYCTDDIARAFIVAIDAAQFAKLRADGLRLARIYLAFLLDAQLPDGRFHNFMGYDRRWLDQIGSGDAHGRSMMAAGAGIARSPREMWSTVCERIMRRLMPWLAEESNLRPMALGGLGLCEILTGRPGDATVAAALSAVTGRVVAEYRAHHSPDWDWFEDVMLYDNARLCELLLRAGPILKDPSLVEVGLATLRFYESVVFENEIFTPIGSQGWYERGGPRARFPQQPIEAEAMIDAELAAFAATGEPHHRRMARRTYEWFFGRNVFGATLVYEGGCSDGIDSHGPSLNMGAESTLAYLASAFALADHAGDVEIVAR